MYWRRRELNGQTIDFQGSDEMDSDVSLLQKQNIFFTERVAVFAFETVDSKQCDVISSDACQAS
jgi:hypothetical protein